MYDTRCHYYDCVDIAPSGVCTLGAIGLSVTAAATERAGSLKNPKQPRLDEAKMMRESQETEPLSGDCICHDITSNNRCVKLYIYNANTLTLDVPGHFHASNIPHESMQVLSLINVVCLT